MSPNAHTPTSGATNDHDTPVVLIVDDERDLVDLFAVWLSDYAVETAYGGEEALEQLDESVDVVLLDRRMPDRSGEEVLAEIRERGVDCHVAMVTAVEPDVDVLEMGFDDYLTKPTKREEITATVERLLARRRHRDAIDRYYRLLSKQALLESQPCVDVSSDERYEALQAEIEAVEADLDDAVTDLDEEDFHAQLYQIGRDADGGKGHAGQEISAGK